MDLNKDNRDVYTIDSESYSEYMKENSEKPRDLLGIIIQFLIVILLIVLVYLFFNILKNDLTFSEVFNKKEVLSMYESLVDNHDEVQVDSEEYREVLAKKIATEKKNNQQIVSEKTISKEATPPKIVVVEKVKPIIKNVEKKEEPSTEELKSTVQEKRKTEVITVEKVIVVKEEPKPLERIEKVEVKKIVKSEPVEVIENGEVPEEGELTESYLDRMVAELNSEI